MLVLGTGCLRDAVEVLVDNLHLALRAELIEHLGEVCRIVLVIHFGGHLKDDELVDCRVDFLASFDLHVSALPTELEHAPSELMQIVVCLVDDLLVIDFEVFELHQAVHHDVVDLLALNVGELCFVLDFLVLYDGVFSVSCRPKVRHCCLFYFLVDLVQLFLLFCCFGDNLRIQHIVGFDKLLERLDAVRVHILTDLGRLAGPSSTARLEVGDLL